MKIRVAVNGVPHELSVPPLKRMLDVLREDLKLTGAKEGCGEGECGACAVLMNGALVDTCLVPAIQMAGAGVLTVEALAGRDADGGLVLDDLQRFFLEEGAVHCGFCTPGVLMAAVALLAKNPHPHDEAIRVALAGNICRCTGYERIFRAVRRAADAGYGDRLVLPANECAGAPPVFDADEAAYCCAPPTLEAALETLSSGDDWRILAGGTDIGPDLRNGGIRPVRVMDVFGLPALKGIGIVRSQDAPYIRIGAGATNADILSSRTAREHLPALVAASSHSGAAAIQNRATVGGNLCTASGAGDLPVVLLTLGASVVAASRDGTRTLPLDDFIVGYRTNALRADELLLEIRVPLPAPGARQVFYKRGSRRALTLARVSLAFYAHAPDGRIRTFRAAAGSMSPVPIRLEGLDRAMPGRIADEALADEAARIAYDDVNPRKTPQYRKTIVANLTHRFFSELCREPE